MQLFKRLILVLVFFSLAELIAQEKTIDGLIAYAKSYDTISTNTKKYQHLLKIGDFLTDFPKEAINDLSNKNGENYIIKLIIADYFRLKNDYNEANKNYSILEQDLLKENPLDYILLASTIWKSSNNISLDEFSFENELKILYRGLDYAKKSQVTEQMIEFHWLISYYNDMTTNYEKSFYHNKMCYELAKKANDTMNIIFALKKIAGQFNSVGDGENAIKIWNKIQPLVKKTKINSTSLSEIYHTATDTYIALKEIDSATHYNQLSLEIDSTLGNNYRYCISSLQKANILMQSNKNKEAEYEFLKTYDLAKKYRNKRIEALVAINLSKIYLDQNLPNKAYNILTSTYQMKSTIRDYYKATMELRLSQSFEANEILDSALYYRNLSDATMAKEKRETSNKQAALAKIELDVYDYIQENESLEESNESLNQQVTKTTNTRNILIFSLLTLGVLASFFFYQKNQKEKLRLSQYQEQLSHKERMALESELNSIRSQMNPHFMFNSLNSINEFIQNDSSEEASNYLVKFSRLMRSTLNYSKRKYVTLKEEIELLKLYLELENLRFYNSIDVRFSIDDSINLEELFIPPMMLQPFVENAIWHGLMNKENNRKLELRFYNSTNAILCEIEDNGIGRTASKALRSFKTKHKSQGMSLTQRRLELLQSIHGKEAKVEVKDLYKDGIACGTLVKVILPNQSNV